jgi:diacylglycerol O-acyltransferase
MSRQRSTSEADEYPHRMSPTDSLMWRVEKDPRLRSTITAVSLLDRSPDREALRERVVLATGSIPRLRQRVVDRPAPLGAPEWETDPFFDLDYHFRWVQLRSPASLETVLHVASTSAMASFDRGRPLWEFAVVEGLEGGKAVLVQKIHHSVADGIAGLRLAAGLLDLERSPSNAPPPAAEHMPAPAGGESSGGGSLGRQLGAAVAGAATAAVAVPAAVVRAGAQLARSPRAATGRAVDSARWAARLVAPVRSPRSSVMLGRGTSLLFDAFDVGLEELRAAASAAGCKLNDAYLAAVAGGLARYHERHDRPVASLRMTLPISTRRPGDPLGGNRITLVRMEVPVGGAPQERMRRVRDLVGEWRGSPAIGMTDVLTRGLNALPASMSTAIFGQMLRNVDFVATNVPGFPAPLYVGGAEILRLYAFAPPCGSAFNVSLISHVGTCCIGLNIDTAAVPDGELLVECLKEGFDEVL